MSQKVLSQPQISVRARPGVQRVSVLDIEGEISAFAEGALMEAYTQASNQGAAVIVLNFDKLDYMNSSGIGLLVTLLIRANRQGQKLYAVGLNEHYQRIFELTRLNEAFQIYDTEEKALAAASVA